MRDPREPPRRIDVPEAGYFTMRLVRGGPIVAARIELDANGCWSACIDGQLCGEPAEDPVDAPGVFHVWTSANRSTQGEYEFLLARRAWALEHDRTHPAANPRQKIDLARMRSLARYE